MLSKKSISAIAKAAGIAVDVLTQAISDEEEKDVTVTTVKAFTKEGFEEFEENIETEKQEEYNKGKEVGANQTIRDLKEEAGLDYVGKKKDGFVEKFKAKVLEDAGKSPDKEVATLKEDLRVLKEETIPGLNTQIDTYKKNEAQAKIDANIKKHLPKKLPNGMSEDDALLIVKNNLEFTTSDNKPVVKKDGAILKDDSRNPITYEAAIGDFATERKWTNADGGRGGGDDVPPGSPTDYKTIRKSSELNKYFDDNNIHPLGEKARAMQAEVQKAAKDAKEEFVFDE